MEAPTTSDLVQRINMPAQEEDATGTFHAYLHKACEPVLDKFRRRKPGENGKMGRMQTNGEVASELILWAYEELKKDKDSSTKS